MLNCRSQKLEAMPYAMAEQAVDAPLYLSETRTARSKDLLPCAAFGGRFDSSAAGAGNDGDHGNGEEKLDAEEQDEREAKGYPLYCDHPTARVWLPRDMAPPGVRRVHLLTASADSTVEESFHKEVMQTITGGADKPFLSFVPSRDCRYQIAI